MQFNFRGNQPNGNARPPHSSSGLGYFAQQALRVGYMRPDLARQGNFLPPPGNVRDTVLREIEKQQIRQEIIAAEERRRHLEEEVRREMLMEREMALRSSRGHPFVPGPQNMLVGPMPISNPSENRFRDALPIVNHSQNGFKDSKPFSRASEVRISEVKATPETKERIVFLPKSEGSVPGVKRKAVTPPATSNMRLMPDSRKKLKEMFHCELCQVSATSELAMKEHLDGKKHKSRQKRQATQISGQSFAIGLFSRKPITEITKEEPKEKASEEKQVEEVKDEAALQVDMNDELALTKTVQKDSLKFKFWCEMCKIGAFSEKVMNAHMRGKKHTSLLLESLNSKLAAASGNNSVPVIATEKEEKEVKPDSATESKVGEDVERAPVENENKDKKCEGTGEVAVERSVEPLRLGWTV